VSDTVFWRCLTGEQCSSRVAMGKLTSYYNHKASMKAELVSKTDPVYTVLLLDEVDFLSSGDGNVIYAFFNYPIIVNSRLALICISNYFDLPDKLTARIRSRIGSSMERMGFKPYTFDQVCTLVGV
jgi:Cdc6-like AAA superfamily ATPase